MPITAPPATFADAKGGVADAPHGIGLDRFATISAATAEGDRPLPDVLRAHGVSFAAWSEAQAHHLRAIAADAMLSDTPTLAEQYAALLAVAQDALKPVPAMTPEEWASLELDVAARGQEALADRGLTGGDHMRLSRRFAKELSANRALAKRYAAALAARKPQTTPPPPPEKAASEDVEKKSAPPPAPLLIAIAPAPKAPPIAAEAPLPPPPATAPSLSAEATAAILAIPEDISGDVTLPIPSVDQRRASAKDPLPFQPPPKAAPSPTPAARPVQPQKGFIDVTLPPAEHEAIRAAALSPLPFKPPATGEPRAADPAEAKRSRAAQRSGLPFRPDKSTQVLPVMPSPPGIPAVLPFAPVAAPVAAPTPALPRLSFEHYAELCAALLHDPSHALEIRARYGLADDTTWALVHGGFQEKLRRDPALQSRWAELTVQKYAPRQKR